MNKRTWCAVGVLSLGLLLGWGTGCRQQTQQEQDQQIRQQAEQATEQARKDAKIAAANAKVAAQEATRQLKDVAQGVRDGLRKDGAGGDRIDVNSASRDRLETLPGITAGRARAIVDRRPYGETHDLVKKGVLSESQYERISGQVTAR
jgi:DNA uptake protein ComE-like DNA-binding protein